MMGRMIDAVGALCGLAGAGAFAAYSVRGRSAALLAPSVYRGDRSRATLALTFDDGPSESTPALLKLLAQHKVRATFFMCGQNVRRLPQIAKAVVEAGHEVGNHTDTHPRLDFKSADFIYRELALAQEIIQSSTGATPRFFRAPYGVRWFGLRSAQARLRLTGAMWTVIGRDWKLPESRVLARLLQHASNGGILCLHDGRTTQVKPDVQATLGAIEKAIPILKDRGFAFLTLSEMVGEQRSSAPA